MAPAVLRAGLGPEIVAYNVATPGTQTGFLWMMAATEEEDRVFTQVTVQPEFAGDRFKLF